jgi:hypothetical protein
MEASSRSNSSLGPNYRAESAIDGWRGPVSPSLITHHRYPSPQSWFPSVMGPAQGPNTGTCIKPLLPD